jgi:hypothetical protein
MLQKLAVLLTYAPAPHLPNSSLDLSVYLARLATHERVLLLLLPGSRTPLRGDDLAGEPQCPQPSGPAWLNNR